MGKFPQEHEGRTLRWNPVVLRDHDNSESPDNHQRRPV